MRAVEAYADLRVRAQTYQARLRVLFAAAPALRRGDGVLVASDGHRITSGGRPCPVFACGGLRAREVAARAGVNVQTLRYYEGRGLLEIPPRSPSGYPVYPEGTVRTVR